MQMVKKTNYQTKNRRFVAGLTKVKALRSTTCEQKAGNDRSSDNSLQISEKSVIIAEIREFSYNARYK